MFNFLLTAQIIFLLLLSQSCKAEDSDAPAKFYDDLRPQIQAQSPRQTQATEKYYIVKPNEILSAIAARYGYNYIKLAKWNNLPPPYKVLTGQRLKLFDDTKITVDTSETSDADSMTGNPLRTASHLPQLNNTVDDNALEQELEMVTANVNQAENLSTQTASHPTVVKKEENSLEENYIVGRNETLYSIALRFGMSPQRLADLNNLNSPNQLYAGQKLKILKEKQKDSLLKIVGNSSETAENLRDNAQKTSIISINNESMLKFYYQWPTTGKILKNFTQSGSRGIEIGGQIGQAIKAAASGKVVAVSPGIYGHGGFIVIQHDDQNISSYSNTSRSLVTNGQKVKQGQVIAQMGQVGPKRPSLEFEIRKNGRLVDPLRLLPKKL
jgi:lipoprotein NlpD